ncbi:uncharacterized protein C9orf40 homolog [Lepisosteus oculatus]|uniref:uncharacterized protein C9orf40 homolog n=1 Tax=Lepisosteus oculatus TaxID=7918 RepID=UPI00371A5682
MTKRRAENILLYNGPLKRCIRPLYKIGAHDQGIPRATCVDPPLPLTHNTKKRALIEGEFEKANSPCKRRIVNELQRERHTTFKEKDVSVRHISGSFQQDDKPEARGAVDIANRNNDALKRNNCEGDNSFEDGCFKLDKVSPKEEELCHFNSFQYWRIPLPDLDLSELQDPGLEELPEHSATETDMET